MRLDELMRTAGRLFEEERVDYFVYGAVAMNFWVPPRMTVDLDVVVCVDKPLAVKLSRSLRRRRLPMSTADARLFLEGRLVRLRLGDTALDLKLGRRRHEREALARAKPFAADDFRLRIAVPEDLVLFKLQSWRLQDQADVERLLRLRKDLDVPLIERWLDPLAEETGFPLRARWARAIGS